MQARDRLTAWPRSPILCWTKQEGDKAIAHLSSGVEVASFFAVPGVLATLLVEKPIVGWAIFQDAWSILEDRVLQLLIDQLAAPVLGQDKETLK